MFCCRRLLLYPVGLYCGALCGKDYGVTNATLVANMIDFVCPLLTRSHTSLHQQPTHRCSQLCCSYNIVTRVCCVSFVHEMIGTPDRDLDMPSHLSLHACTDVILMIKSCMINPTNSPRGIAWPFCGGIALLTRLVGAIAHECITRVPCSD